MRYDNLRAFEKHLENAAALHLSPIYAIIGKESYDCKEAIGLLLRFLTPSEKQELAIKVWDALSADFHSLFEDLDSLSLFVEKRVILIKNSDKIKKKFLDKLEKYISRPSRSQYLIFSGPSLSRQSSFYKLLEKEGIILEFADLKPWEKEKKLVEWVNKQVTASRKLISYSVCQQFVKQLGTDQELLFNELQKLFCYVGSRQEIVWQDVNRICTQMPLDNIWQLGEAIFKRDAASALKAVHAMLPEQPFLPLLRQIRNQFVTEFHICTMLEQGCDSPAITREYPYMKGQILEKHIEHARRYGVHAFRKGLLEIDAIEVRAKNSQIDEMLLAEILISKLTQKNN